MLSVPRMDDLPAVQAAVLNCQWRPARAASVIRAGATPHALLCPLYYRSASRPRPDVAVGQFMFSAIMHAMILGRIPLK